MRPATALRSGTGPALSRPRAAIPPTPPRRADRPAPRRQRLPPLRTHSQPPDATWTVDESVGGAPTLSSADDDRFPLAARLGATLTTFFNHPRTRAGAQIAQSAASVAFVVLYVWSTYDLPAPGSARALADAGLCVAFAVDYVVRFIVRA